jgi:hypothetical protein
MVTKPAMAWASQDRIRKQTLKWQRLDVQLAKLDELGI